MRKYFRIWIKAIETFVLEVIFGERHGFKARVMRGILFGSSKIFVTLVNIRHWLCNVRPLRDKINPN